jgi:uncharacterized protein YchJ
MKKHLKYIGFNSMEQTTTNNDEQCTIHSVVDSLNTDSLKYFDEEDVYEIQEMTKYFPTYNRVEQYFRDKPKIGRNEPCSCGSDKKYKKCCM